MRGKPCRGWGEAMGQARSAESPTQRCLCALLTLGDVHVIFARLHCRTAIAVQSLADTQPGTVPQRHSPPLSYPPPSSDIQVSKQYRENIQEKQRRSLGKGHRGGWRSTGPEPLGKRDRDRTGLRQRGWGAGVKGAQSAECGELGHM